MCIGSGIRMKNKEAVQEFVQLTDMNILTRVSALVKPKAGMQMMKLLFVNLSVAERRERVLSCILS